MKDFIDKDDELNCRFLWAWETRQKLNTIMHERINHRALFLDWAIAKQELKTDYIKAQHVLPF